VRPKPNVMEAEEAKTTTYRRPSNDDSRSWGFVPLSHIIGKVISDRRQLRALRRVHAVSDSVRYLYGA
jgi:hypothetical protein